MKGPASPSSPAHRQVEIDTLRDSGAVHRGDAIAVEEPLEIRLVQQGTMLNGGTGQAVSITMRTPGNDAELALGFLYGEGMLRETRDVLDAMRQDVDTDLPELRVRRRYVDLISRVIKSRLGTPVVETDAHHYFEFDTRSESASTTPSRTIAEAS